MKPEPAQPAESPEARAEHAVSNLIALCRLKFGNTDPSASVAMEEGEWLLSNLAASTARPTERGAVEAQALSLVLEMADPDLRAATSELRATWQKQARRIATLAAALPATDQVAEVERLREALQGIADYPEGNWHGDMTAVRNRAREALATQPATGRTMGGEVDWRRLAKLAGEHGVRFKTNRGMEAFLAALQNGGE